MTKNDVRTDTVSIEYKHTGAKSYSLKLAELLTAEKNALLDSGRDFAFIIEMGGREWMVVPREFGEVLLRGPQEQADLA